MTWITHAPGGCPVDPETNVEYQLEGDPNTYCDPAGSLAWGDLEDGRIVRYRTLSIGNLSGDELGSAARYNVGKVPLELIPLEIVAEYAARSRHVRSFQMSAQGHEAALSMLGRFQMGRGDADLDDRELLLDAIWHLDADGGATEDCARVFDYGRKKYAEWNWAKGQAWSVPIACAARHLVFGMMRGETLDPDSGLPHRGHFVCNIVMLLWFLDHYEAGDDRRRQPPVLAP